jgi:ubiquinone/menaquinone biosynthesis C-methylase UbiE
MFSVRSGNDSFDQSVLRLEFSFMPVSAIAHLNFGYPWWLSYGHLPIVAVAVAILFLGYRRKWSTWPMLLLGVLVLWSSAAFLVTRFLLDVNGRASLPTQSFLRSGAGRVLDMGAGTGRSSIMVLESRPHVTLVALDLFTESFEQHFGRGESPQQRLLANLEAAGVAQRTTIKTGDMRNLPFEPATFDAVVSAYAIDHLNRQGINQALAEAARVMKPGGDFLLILLAKEPWVQFAFGPLLMHGGVRGKAWWTTRLQEAGFQVLEEGTRPATLYLLARRK